MEFSMKTSVPVERELFGEVIRQNSKDKFFSATDLIDAGNKWRVNNGKKSIDLYTYFKQKSSKEFIKSLEGEFGVVKRATKGRGASTWVHPFLFIDIALYISPELKIEAYKWLYDNLIEYRNYSGDNYIKFTGTIFDKVIDKDKAKKEVVRLGYKLKKLCKVDNWSNLSAGEDKLKFRKMFHDSFYILGSVMTDIDRIFDAALKQATIMFNDEKKSQKLLK
jgi:hypothetical protein